MSDPRSKRPLPTRFWLTALGALAWWILTAVFTVADITDDFPRSVTIFSASVCVVLTVLLMLIYVGARWVAPLQEAVDTLIAERDQVLAAARRPDPVGKVSPTEDEGWRAYLAGYYDKNRDGGEPLMN